MFRKAVAKKLQVSGHKHCREIQETPQKLKTSKEAEGNLSQQQE